MNIAYAMMEILKATFTSIARNCGKVIDFFGEPAPKVEPGKEIEGNIVLEEQLYYRGICAECAKKGVKSPLTETVH